MMDLCCLLEGEACLSLGEACDLSPSEPRAGAKWSASHPPSLSGSKSLKCHSTEGVLGNVNKC